MNCIQISGTLAGDSELRTIESGKELLNFDVCVHSKKADGPYIRVGFFPRNGDVRELKGGAHVMVYGELRHRRDYDGLFLAAHEIFIIETPHANRQ